MDMLGFGLSAGVLTSARSTQRGSRCSRWRMDYSLESKERLDVLFGEEGQGEVTAKYKFGLKVSGGKSKEVFQTIFGEFKKNAKFPGFRKGQVPPFMKPKIVSFALEEVLADSLTYAIESSNLKKCEGQAFVPEYDPKVNDMRKDFKPGEDLSFSVEIACVEDTSAPSPAKETSEVEAASET
ncbi:hypothetical protein NDN08_002847 [Rhodosorus marinus]|uniref:Trigger factor ribosome-binding bacterial domain-containing protein n=1 Tax=Rhodosorus marinus TaxID=101924 RepID=A0AAV8UWC8_9RHOD|nr:hypothetical protein NDN08_002847 [Rhodosorus marinus]